MRRLIFRTARAVPPPLPAVRTATAIASGDDLVIGIDPGTLRVGYAVVASSRDSSRDAALACGVIRTRRSGSIDRRLLAIHEGLRGIIDRWRPSSAAVESAFFGRSAPAAIRIGEGRGAAILTAAACGIPVTSYPPAEVKKAVVGNGAAHKRQVQAMVRALLGADLPFDAADAAAVALCHLRRVAASRHTHGASRHTHGASRHTHGASRLTPRMAPARPALSARRP